MITYHFHFYQYFEIFHLNDEDSQVLATKIFFHKRRKKFDFNTYTKNTVVVGIRIIYTKRIEKSWPDFNSTFH